MVSKRPKFVFFMLLGPAVNTRTRTCGLLHMGAIAEVVQQERSARPQPPPLTNPSLHLVAMHPSTMTFWLAVSSLALSPPRCRRTSPLKRRLQTS